jgi:hypothetical protein
VRAVEAATIEAASAVMRTMPSRRTEEPRLLSGGNYATILSAGTWRTETALAGWGERTRTQESVREPCI